MKYIIGKKLNMSQIFDEEGNVIPVTEVLVEPCFVIQVKSVDKDGYMAVQVGGGKKKRLNKPERGHLNHVDKKLPNLAYLTEFRFKKKLPEIKEGDALDISIFEIGDMVNVTGYSKGRGFQGVVKRHGFGGSPKSHGHKDQLRMPGSIGATDPAHVFKGTRMAGRMGGDKITIKNLKIVNLDKDKNILSIKGAIPGSYGSWVKIWMNEQN